MKHSAFIFRLLCISLFGCLLCACSDSNIKAQKYKSVDVIPLQVENRAIYYQYTGTLLPKEIKKYAFQTGGTIEHLPVKVGDQVQKGELLASLDAQKQGIAVGASLQQENQAYQNYLKAKDAQEFLKKEVEDLRVLLESGAASQSEYDGLVLKYEMAQKELNQASSAYEQSKLKKNFDASQRSDTNLYSDMDGEVLELLNAKSEVVGAGYPVVIVGSQEKQLFLGASSEEIKHIEKGGKALIQAGDQVIEGVVSKLSLMPDKDSQNYEIQVDFNFGSEKFVIGELLKVKILKEQKEGIWIDFAHIQNDGRDYVFVAVKDEQTEEYRSVKKYIDILALDKESVLVEGLDKDDLLITSNSKSLTDGYQVQLNGE